MTYEFLSPEWIAAAESLRAAYGGDVPAAVALTMNLNVTDVPSGTSPLLVSLDTSRGVLALALGHLATADITITVDWATAKALLIEGKPQAAMSAFMNGKVRIEGDMSKLVAMQSTPPDPVSERVIDQLRAITA